MHFGLGNAKTATISIEWPDGSLTKHETKTNQIITIYH
ncbi:ASPIC/UnbV domain-containing protein [Amylibacter sp.]|nr:ASPIC/UnbV domain-containing protein [Amylibacter sp.]